MASLHKRLSLSSPRSRRSGRSQSPLSRLVVAPNSESEEWVREWEDTMARGACLYALTSPLVLLEPDEVFCHDAVVCRLD